MRGHEHQDWVRRARAVPIEREIERRGIKLKRNGLERVGACPKCGGEDRFAINIKKGVFNCRGCGMAGDVISLVEALDGVDFNTACTQLTGQPPPKANGKDTSKKVVVATFEYQNPDGSVAFAVDRIQLQKPDGGYVLKDGKPDKAFRQRRPDPDHAGRWIFNKDGAPIVPYHLPQVLEAIAADHPVLIVEGEAKADLLSSWNVTATCCAGGAKKWKAEHSEYLRGAVVVLLPDNDNAGWEHANKVGAALTSIAKSVRVLVLPHAKAKDDIVDWHNAGGTREQLDELIAKAADWEPPAEKLDLDKTEAAKSEDELLDALARTPKGLAFGRERRRLKKKLGLNLSDLDAEIEVRRDEAESEAHLHGHWIVEPWPEPVDGDALIRDIVRKLHKHIVISHDGALAITLWTMLAWVHDEVATHSPILDVTSAEPNSGKTTTLGVVSYLVPRAISSVDISRGALYRSIQRWQPSFVIDEFDDVLAAKNDSDKAELRAVINSGHTRGQGVLRCVTDEHKPELFSTFCPKAVGMVGQKMPATTLSRCIAVELRRRKKSEGVQSFKHEDDSELRDLRSRLRRWSMDNTEALRGCTPKMPDDFENRLADNWRVQFAIADLAGEDWGDQARVAAAKIDGASDSRTVNARALADIKGVFFPNDGEPLARTSSADLAAQLGAIADSPWSEWRHGKPITQAQLARVLKPYGIAPEVIRLLNGGTIRGYLRTQFEDAWDRYL
jgi:Protein of unknown function (DUF3631)/CHC2 zinc finger